MQKNHRLRVSFACNESFRAAAASSPFSNAPGARPSPLPLPEMEEGWREHLRAASPMAGSSAPTYPALRALAAESVSARCRFWSSPT
eukprot:8296213-Pyramimonas_sp.AAC.1